MRKNKQEATEMMKIQTKKTAMGMKRKGMEIKFLGSKTQLFMFTPMSIHTPFPVVSPSKLPHILRISHLPP